MSATLVGALVTAGVLGVTHAIEPDHVAGISSLTSQYGDSRLSAVVGACFSLGHVALVVAWLAVGYLLLGRTDYPVVFDTVGTLGVGVVLGVLGAVMTVGGLRSAVHAHRHEHDGEVHSHAHVHLPLVGDDHEHEEGHSHEGHEEHDHSNEGHDHGPASADAHLQKVPATGHEHGHGVGHYLKTGIIGALFTLSPPLSMIAFSATLFPAYGGSAVALAVVTYAVAITVTMSAVGAGAGALFGAVSISPRAYGTARALAGLVVVGLAATLLLEALPAAL